MNKDNLVPTEMKFDTLLEAIEFIKETVLKTDKVTVESVTHSLPAPDDTLVTITTTHVTSDNGSCDIMHDDEQFVVVVYKRCD